MECEHPTDISCGCRVSVLGISTTTYMCPVLSSNKREREIERSRGSRPVAGVHLFFKHCAEPIGATWLNIPYPRSEIIPSET